MNNRHKCIFAAVSRGEKVEKRELTAAIERQINLLLKDQDKKGAVGGLNDLCAMTSYLPYFAKQGAKVADIAMRIATEAQSTEVRCVLATALQGLKQAGVDIAPLVKTLSCDEDPEVRSLAKICAAAANASEPAFN